MMIPHHQSGTHFHFSLVLTVHHIIDHWAHEKRKASPLEKEQDTASEAMMNDR